MSRCPNVVLFISDQQRADTLPGQSAANVRVPHMAWLAKQGAQFNQAFCTVPLCTPARTSILSGLYPHTHGIVGNYSANRYTPRDLKGDLKLISQYLSPAGYACAYTGKWHLPTGSDRPGFDAFVSRYGSHDVDSEEEDDALHFAGRAGLEIGKSFDTYLTSHKRRRGDPNDPLCGRTTRLPLAFHPSTLQAQQAARFVHTMRTSDQPFLLVYSCIEPHPMSMNYDVAPCPFDKMYDPQTMPLPATCRDSNAPFVLRKRNQGNKLRPTDFYNDDQLRAMIAGYHGAVSYVDHLLGVIIEALISTDQLDDTIVIFTSDHGEMLGDHRMLRKGPVMFEQLIRVPLIIKPPQVTDAHNARPSAGVQIQRLVSHVDLVPTILHYCGQTIPDELQGHDLSDLIQGSDEPVRDAVAIEYYARAPEKGTYHPIRAWRTPLWKYVETIGGGDELYRLDEDPEETRNLIDDPGATADKQRLKEAFYAWLKSSGDPWPNLGIPEVSTSDKFGPWEELAKKEQQKGS